MNTKAKEYFDVLNAQLNKDRHENVVLVQVLRKEEQKLEMLTNRFTVDIANQIDPDTCKPKYSNTEKRDAELLVRQTNSNEWMSMFENIDALKSKIAHQGIDISTLQNEIHYMLNHVSDEFEGELRAFRQETSDQIQQSAAHYAKKFIIEMLAGISINLEVKDPTPPDFVNQGTPISVANGCELGKMPADPYTAE